MCWGIVGIYVGYEAHFSNYVGECGVGRSQLWYCLILLFLQMRWCHVWSVNSAHDEEEETQSLSRSQQPVAPPEAGILGRDASPAEAEVVQVEQVVDASEDASADIGCGETMEVSV